MSALINKVEMENFDTLSIPSVVTLTFTNGEVCTYKEIKEGFEDPECPKIIPMFTLPRCDFSDQKLEERSFEAMSNNYTSQLGALDKWYQSASKELLKIYESLKKKIKSRSEGLKDPASRIKTIIRWLRAT